MYLEPPCNVCSLKILRASSHFVVSMFCVNDFVLEEKEKCEKITLFYCLNLIFMEGCIFTLQVYTSRQHCSFFAEFLGILGSQLECFICPFNYAQAG